MSPPSMRTAAVLAAVFAVDVLLFSPFLGLSDQAPARLAVVLLELPGVVALLARHRAPRLVFGFCLAHAVVATVVWDLVDPVATVLVALVALTERRRMAESLVAASMSLAAFGLVVQEAVALAPPATRPGVLAANACGFLLVTVLAWVLGRWWGRNSRHIRRLRAEQDELRQRAERAVADERARMARELHDIVSSAVTAMVLHAAGARRLVHSEPERVAGALGTIQESGAQAMSELRRMLGLLRATETAAPGRLAELDELVESIRATGVAVEVTRRGDPVSLEPSVDLAAYRVVQEALTNVAKHAGSGARATVRLDWTSDAVDIRVEDDGAGGPRPPTGLSTGHGLLGLRERLGVVGGALTAAPYRNGYRVDARLPVATVREEVPA